MAKIQYDNKYFEPYFKGTNFGSIDYSDLVMDALLKVACGYYNGATISRILIDADLVELKGKKKVRHLT